MEFNEYAKAAKETAVYPGHGEFAGLAYAALGLNGEAGEVAEKVKKLWRDNGELNKETRDSIKKELGDVLWYVAAGCDEIGVSMEDVAAANLVKLKSRAHRNVLAGWGDNR